MRYGGMRIYLNGEDKLRRCTPPTTASPCQTRWREYRDNYPKLRRPSARCGGCGSADSRGTVSVLVSILGRNRCSRDIAPRKAVVMGKAEAVLVLLLRATAAVKRPSLRAVQAFCQHKHPTFQDRREEAQDTPCPDMFPHCRLRTPRGIRAYA